MRNCINDMNINFYCTQTPSIQFDCSEVYIYYEKKLPEKTHSECNMHFTYILQTRTTDQDTAVSWIIFPIATENNYLRVFILRSVMNPWVEVAIKPSKCRQTVCDCKMSQFVLCCSSFSLARHTKCALHIRTAILHNVHSKLSDETDELQLIQRWWMKYICEFTLASLPV